MGMDIFLTMLDKIIIHFTTKSKARGDIMINSVPRDLPPVLKLKDVAAYFQRSTWTIRRRTKNGDIRSYKEGQEYRFRREWVLEYEQECIAKGELP